MLRESLLKQDSGITILDEKVFYYPSIFLVLSSSTFTGKIKLLREVREAIIQEEETKKTKSRELTQQNSHQVELESLNFISCIPFLSQHICSS